MTPTSALVVLFFGDMGLVLVQLLQAADIIGLAARGDVQNTDVRTIPIEDNTPSANTVTCSVPMTNALRGRFGLSVDAATHALTLDQTANLLEYLSHCDHPQFTGPRIRSTVAHYIGLLLFTGIRREEAARLKWSDVDRDAGTFTLHDSKNGLDFVVPMSIPVHGVLTARQALTALPVVQPGLGFL
jgi:hypothetical protein